MNLLDILSYRTRCLICERKLEMKSLDLANVLVTRTNEGLYLEVGGSHKDYAVYFKYDGTYEKMKKWNDMYVKPLSIIRECPKCIPNIKVFEDDAPAIGRLPPPSTIILKARSVGMTTIGHAMNSFLSSSLNSLKDKRCAYKFDLFGDAQGYFDCQLSWEDIRFYNKTDFYHVKTDFKQDITNLKTGNFKTDTIDSMVKLEVPALKTSNIGSTDRLIEKLRLYNLFS